MNWKYYNPKFEYEEKFQDLAWPWAGHKYFAYDLIANLKPKVIVELGTHYGTSFWAFSQAVKDQNIETELNAVDTWKGDEHAHFYGEEVFEKVKDIKNTYYSDLKINLIRKTFDEAIKDFEDDSIDVLHIDGLHTYEAVKHDFENWLPKVKEGGIVLFHDIVVNRDDFGVYKLWGELKEKYKTMEFRHSYGLGVLFKSKNNLLLESKEELELHYSYLLEDIENGKIANILEESNKKDQEIQEKEQIIQDENKEIKNLDKVVNQNKKEIKNLNQIILQKDQEINDLRNSTSWKITKPIRFIKDKIKKSKNIVIIKNKKTKSILSNNHYDFNSTQIKLKDIPSFAISKIKRYGFRVFIYKLINYFKNGINYKKQLIILKNKDIVKNILNEKFYNSQKINFIKVNRNEFRFNIVLDSTKKQSLFGGVATSLILATLFSNKYKIPLRIITRETENNPDDYEKFLDFMQIIRPDRVEFFSDYDRNNGKNNFKLETSDKDIFLATSWWSAEAIKSVNLREKSFYILQEVEKFFYPNGDDKYMSENILQNKNINFIINSKLLYDYYLINNYNNIITRGIYFEPAFLEHIYFPGENTFKEKTKYKLLFYARPNNPRNLFYTGIKILDKAIQEGVIKTEEWEIYFAGSNIPELVFSNGMKPIMLGHMDWQEYSNFLKEVDLGFCLMYTPHPSYPPLDIVSSGGVVLTNSYLNKQSLEYSKNIICVNLDEESMLDGFEKAICLVKDISIRKNNYNDNYIERNWSNSFKNILDYINKNK